VGAPGDWEENKGIVRGAGSLILAESKKFGDDACRLRRAISAAWRLLWQEGEREMEEKATGYL
jgi:hypothetical protein